jgi:TonB family protein
MFKIYFGRKHAMSASIRAWIMKSIGPRAISFAVRVPAVLAIAANLGLGAIGPRRTMAQEAPGGIEKLTRALAAELEKAHVKRVAIFDLETADGKQIPFGGWLTDRISEDVVKSGTAVAVVDRGSLTGLPNGGELDPDAGSRLRSATANSLGADAYVYGTFAAIGDGIGVTLNAQRVGGELLVGSQTVPVAAAAGKISLDDSARRHLGVPIDSLRPLDGAYTPGKAGIGPAKCVRCRQPQFSDEAIRRKIEGVVELDVLISAEGKPLNVVVTKKAGAGLDEQAVKGVRKWTFEPAVDADGGPVAVHQPVEVTFRFR